MCAEKIQRVMMAIVLGITMAMFLLPNYVQIAVIVQTFVIIMLLIWALTNVCPSIWILRKLIGSCDQK
jgi:uncharacterized membrane protein YgaE (UPF0421/DUF939 family)